MISVTPHIPLLWQDIFAAGPHDGFMLRDGGHILAFVNRGEDQRLVIEISAALQPAQQDLPETPGAILCREQNWSHLVFFLAPGSSPTDITDLMQMAESRLELMSFSERVALGSAHAAAAALVLGKAGMVDRVLALCPPEPLSDWPEGRSQLMLLHDPEDTPPTLPADSFAVPLQTGGKEPLSIPAGSGLEKRILSAAIEGSLTADNARQLLTEAIPDMSGESACSPATPNTNWPSARGNIWMLTAEGNRQRYLSDRWAGRVIGYEEIAGITIAQTPPVLRGIIAIGNNCGIPRPLTERYPWHVTDERLLASAPDFGARAQGTLLAMEQEAAGFALPGIIAIDLPCPGNTPADIAPESALRQELARRIEKAITTAHQFGKVLHIDRVSLGLFSGAVTLDVETALDLYCEIIAWLRQIIPSLTRQASAPVFVLTQASGGRRNGRAESILAEGRLETELLSDLVVAGTAYPFALMDEMPATPDPQSLLIMDEIESYAVQSLRSGERWYCPSLRLARVNGTRIIAEFTAASPLVLEDDPHGFRLEGDQAGSNIIAAQLLDKTSVELTCDHSPEGENIMLSYAWGWTTCPETSSNHSANHGSLRDSWQVPSKIVSDCVLHRYALAGMVPLLPVSD